MSGSLLRTDRTRPLAIPAIAVTGLLVLAGCSGDGGGGSTDGGGGGGGGEVTADNLYALPEGYSENIIIEVGPITAGNAFSNSAALIEAIETLSNGQMTVEVSAGYALYGATEATPAIRDGVAQMGTVAPSYEPAGWDNYTWFSTAMDGPITTTRPVLAELASFASGLEQAFEDPYLEAEFEKQGVIPLIPRTLIHSGYHLLCTDEVTSLDDTNGTLVRTAGPNWVSEAEAVGLTPVAIPPADQFEALQRGVVDCVMGPLRDWGSLDLLSVATHLTMDDEAAFVGFPMSYAANPAWWNGLPPGAQNIIWTAVFEWVTAYATAQAMGDALALQRVAGDDSFAFHSMGDDLRAALLDFQEHKREDLLANPPAGSDPEVLAAELDKAGELFQSWMEYLEADPDLGGFYPETWPEFAEMAPEIEEITAPAWKERVWEEIFLPRMPNPGN